jgi:hypothetical protein
MIYSIDQEFLIQFDIDLLSLEDYDGYIRKDLIMLQPMRRIPKSLIESIKRIIHPEAA